MTFGRKGTRPVMDQETNEVRPRPSRAPALDAVDRKLLGLLADDATRAYAELGRLLHLSPPAVHERVKRLKRDGVIKGVVARLDAAGELPALGALLESRAFFGHDTQRTYPAAGSFVRHLVARHGLAPLRAMFAGARFEQPAATTRARFRAAYGAEIDAEWAAWRAALRRPQVTPPTTEPGHRTGR